jgi:iron complex outermembrane recepter protein
MRRSFLGVSVIALCGAALAVPSGVRAQSATPAPQAADDAEIVVTGSFIRGTSKDSALSVNIFTAEDIAKQGSPSLTEIIKALPASSGVIGDTNEFAAVPRGGGGAGTAAVNLRGFGTDRTLVLLNGRRLPLTDQIYVDMNMIPPAAIGRVEVLKDGAGATYGSDAVGGVVNFITRSDFKGLEVSGSYRFISGSKGDFEGNLAWGAGGDWGHLLVVGGVKFRSELRALDRNWAVRPFNENPQGGWTGGGSPGIYAPVQGFTRLGPNIADPACRTLGGVLTNPVPGGAAASAQTPSGFATCRTQFIVVDNLIEKQQDYHAYAEFETDLSDRVSLKLEALGGMTRTPTLATSPSYPNTRGITSTVLPGSEHVLDTGNAFLVLRAGQQSRTSGLSCCQSDAVPGGSRWGVSAARRMATFSGRGQSAQ